MRGAFEDLIEFERACGHEPSESGPAVPEGRVQELRMRLHSEEFNELQRAMSDGDLVGIADGLADLIYVCQGTAVRYGIDLPAAWREVHESNMRKFGPGSWRDETGKIRKPPGWQPPDVAGILASQRPLAETYGKGNP